MDFWDFFPFCQRILEMCMYKPDMNHRIVIKIGQRPASRRRQFLFSTLPCEQWYVTFEYMTAII